MDGKVELNLLVPPSHCEYAGGPCDQEMPKRANGRVLFIYPTSPENIAQVIETTVARLQANHRTRSWETWKTLPIYGQVVFCEICKFMRSSDVVVADVTTLNFNVLFEIGFALGLGLPVLPIRDTTIETDRRDFEGLGLLDTLGYLDFANSLQLAESLSKRIDSCQALPKSPSKIHTDSPLYLLKSPVETEGQLELMALVQRSALRFRTFDPIETPRLSLLEARRQVASSVGVVGNLLDPERQGSKVHNARTALIAGMALAQEKVVLLLQETSVEQPIDYRDIVVTYLSVTHIKRLLDPALRRIIESMQDSAMNSVARVRNILQQLDLGDVAAENEITGLRYYFVDTGQATQARQGHARLVVGRKGAGKTAVFYDVRGSRPKSNDTLVLDLKPEGHQFVELRDFAIEHMTAGLQEHTMVAFWHYILLCELARAALEHDTTIARVDPARHESYSRLQTVYERHDPGWESDFSQRLLRQVKRISSRLGGTATDELGSRLTEVIYSGDVRELNQAVVEYLKTKDSVWMLIDNIDKGWPIRGTTSADMLIVRSLLDATRKIQHQLEGNQVQFDCLVFLRSDIYEHLRIETPDKGKDTAIRLDWEDQKVFEEIIRRRVESSTDLRGSFREIWPQICDPLFDSQDSFAYIVERTLMRPRDLLQFLHTAVDIAINHGHSRIESEDLLSAEKSYSEDMVLSTAFEITDTKPELADLLYVFQGAPATMPQDEVRDRLLQAGVDEASYMEVVELLLWFGFLGVGASDFPEPKFAYNVQSNIRRLSYPLSQKDGYLVIHPAFRAALDIGS